MSRAGRERERATEPGSSREAMRARRLLLAAVPVASLLSFAVQPMMGKRLLPIFGGASGTWLGAMVFFQAALLVGYGWAVWLLGRSERAQRMGTGILAVLAVATFHFPSSTPGSGSGIAPVIWSLTLASLPAVAFLFSISPLVHGWLTRRGTGVPWHLYAISNLGSLAGLLVYPFAVEPVLTLTQQRWIFHAGLVVLAVLLGGAFWLLRRAGSAPVSDPVPEEKLRAWDLLRWVAVSAVTCVAMLGGTQLIVAEIGSSPLAWVGPFGVYLLSFTVTFSGFWRPWMNRVAVLLFGLSFAAFMILRGTTSLPVDGMFFWTLLAAIAGACFVGNGTLHRLRPQWRFDWYYLALAAGGVIGGLLSSFVLPHALPRPLEFHWVAALLLGLGLGLEVLRRETFAQVTAFLLVGFLFAGIAGQQNFMEDPGRTSRHLRNEYGYLLVRESGNRRELVNETTLHGTQYLNDMASRRRPTLYYTESTGVGRVLLQLRQSRPIMQVGVVGLGVGTLAAYGRPGDRFTFWDIDAKSIEVANSVFSYLTDSAGSIQVQEADGRHGLAGSTEDFDVIVIDAFSGDSVPAHLVTVEALQIYFERLKARRGVLLIHTSSRYSAVFPVIAATARAAGQSAIQVVTQMERPAANRDWDGTDSEYIIICPDADVPVLQTWFPAVEDDGRVRRQVTVGPAADADPSLVWTDERSAAWQTINLRRYLAPFLLRGEGDVP